MRHIMRSSVVAATLAAGVLAAATPVLAGDDDGGTKAFWSHRTDSEAPVQRSTEQYRATYASPDRKASRDAAPAAPAPQSDPDYFYHAAGTMGH